MVRDLAGRELPVSNAERPQHEPHHLASEGGMKRRVQLGLDLSHVCHGIEDADGAVYSVQ
ncbi:hypothetical protein [Methylobacterium sp. Leaf106]|uniref:hypothetical protein n=1 Tax=Methylobacterium sp. Leaf106 TaxID=1736255 RepID=UPI0012E8E0BA|nr:hypothetical protein [Methylobacterium sp. Leaf106]